MITDVIVEANIPFRAVERPTFLKLIKSGFPRLIVLGRRKLSVNIKENAKIIKNANIEKLKTVKRCGLTLDLWTVHRR
jgi:hypothetical protein